MASCLLIDRCHAAVVALFLAVLDLYTDITENHLNIIYSEILKDCLNIPKYFLNISKTYLDICVKAYMQLVPSAGKRAHIRTIIYFFVQDANDSK